MKISTCLLLLGAIACYSSSVIAKDTQNDHRELLSSCQALAASPKQLTSNACRYFIQGFIEGMRITDTVNLEPHSDVDSQWSSFTERAYRTRIRNKGNLKEHIRLNYFCLPNDESLDQVIKILSKPLTDTTEATEISESLNEKIFQKLKAEYPCR